MPTIVPTDVFPSPEEDPVMAELVRKRIRINHAKCYWRRLRGGEVEYEVQLWGGVLPEADANVVKFIVGKVVADRGDEDGFHLYHYVGQYNTKVPSDKRGWKLNIVSLLFHTIL